MEKSQLAENRLAEIHIGIARDKALHLFAFSSSVFPSEWSDSYVERIVVELFEFAFHARRVNELCELKGFNFPSASRLLVDFSDPPQGDWESNYEYALNSFMHTRAFKFGNVHADHRSIFLKSNANLTPTYVRIETDHLKNGEKLISIYGIVDCFLSTAIPEIKKKFPRLQF